METCLFNALSYEELVYIDGGKKSVSDWLLLGSGICFCFVQPEIGVPVTIAVFALT